MVVWYFVANGKKQKKTEKNICETYTHLPHRRLRKILDKSLGLTFNSSFLYTAAKRRRLSKFLQTMTMICRCWNGYGSNVRIHYPALPPNSIGDGVLFSINFYFLCLSARYEKTAGPFFMKFSGKVWSDYGTTWLHFWSVSRNCAMLFLDFCYIATWGQGLLCFAPQLVI